MKYKLLIEYDGTRYAGWQAQKKDITIQGELIRAANDLFKTEQVEIYGAGRTDAGVHATGQVAHLAVESPNRSPSEVLTGLNNRLPTDINLLRVEVADDRFHARHHAKSRSYVYRISTRRDALNKRFVWWVPEQLDLNRMQTAAAFFPGFRDFRSFGQIKREDQSTLVDLSQLEVNAEGDLILIHITGSHFLWKMVRRIVGVLVEAGKGSLPVERIPAFFAEGATEPAIYTAPPHGLFLEKVEY